MGRPAKPLDRIKLYDHYTFDPTIPQLLRVKTPYGQSKRATGEPVTDIAYYNGEDRGVFMMAKRFTALSFSCFRHDGENITVVLSRDGDSQSHDLEILGKVFVVAEAATTIKMGTGSATAVLPVVKRLSFTETN